MAGDRGTDAAIAPTELVMTMPRMLARGPAIQFQNFALIATAYTVLARFEHLR